MATSRPVTVVMSAALTPGAMAARFAEPAAATSPKVSITPQTVPSRPRKGAPLTAVASRIICDSRRSAVSPTARSMAVVTTRICAGEIFGAMSSRARKVSSTSAEPRSWKVSSLAARLVDGEDRRAFETRAVGVDAERLAVGAEELEELLAAALRVADDAELRDHDRPTENRRNEEREQDDPPGQRRVLKGERRGRRKRGRWSGKALPPCANDCLVKDARRHKDKL